MTSQPLSSSSSSRVHIRLLAVLVCAAVIAACTSGGGDDIATGNEDTAFDLDATNGAAEDGDSTTTTEPDGEGASTADRSSTRSDVVDPSETPDFLNRRSVTGEVPDELAYRTETGAKAGTKTKTKATTGGSSATSTSTASTKSTSNSGSTTATTAPPRNVTPATTISAGGDPSIAGYKGVLGILDRDQLVTGPRAPAPSVGAGIQPLTGLRGSVPSRPALVAKIDNGGPARPQSGLNQADIVYEEEVEGGVTRFAAVFHSQTPTVGPIRSARTTDIGIINGLGSPVLLYSGANAMTDALIRRQPTVQNHSAATTSGYYRSSSRRAPSNLYADTASHWAGASGGAPPAQFNYRPEGAAVPGVDDSGLTITYRASHAGWTWNGSRYLRTQGGSAHMTSAGDQVSAANVVVVEVRELATGMVDSTGATVPEFVFVGEGKATVFTAGKRIEGIWTRPRMRDAVTLTVNGSVIQLTPGRTWVELIRAGGGMLQ